MRDALEETDRSEFGDGTTGQIVSSVTPSRPFAPPPELLEQDTRGGEAANDVIEQKAAETRAAREEQPPQQEQQQQRPPEEEKPQDAPKLPPLATVEEWYEAMVGVAAGTPAEAVFNAGMEKIGVNYAVKRVTSAGQRDRVLTYQAAAAGQLDWSTGKIVK